MATVTKVQDGFNVVGKHRLHLLDYTGPASYVAGGDPLTARQCALGRILDVRQVQAWNGSAVRLVVWDKTNLKLVWYVPNTGAEASGNLSAFTARIEVLGK